MLELFGIENPERGEGAWRGGEEKLRGRKGEAERGERRKGEASGARGGSKKKLLPGIEPGLIGSEPIVLTARL